MNIVLFDSCVCAMARVIVPNNARTSGGLAMLGWVPVGNATNGLVPRRA